MAITQANKQKWNDTVEKLRRQLNLSDEEVVTIKEWGVALLVTGVSVWILYRIVKKLFGSSKKTMKIEVAPSTKNHPPKDSTSKGSKSKDKAPTRSRSSYSSSPWFPLIRKYVGPLLIALAKRQVDRYLRANHIIR